MSPNGDYSWRIGELEKRLDSHDKILRGNGTEGLVATVAHHNKSLDEIRKYVRGALMILSGLALKAIWDLITHHS